jgi:hypothetical protein
MAKLTAAATWLAAGLSILCSISCSMGADPSELYERGVKESRAEQWEPAINDLESFVHKACDGVRADKRCRKANMTLGAAYEHRGAPARAWVAYDAALTLPPRDQGAAALEDRSRVEQQLRDQQNAVAGKGPVMVRYRDEMTDEFTARSVVVSIDFNPVHERNKGAAELRSDEFTQLWSGVLPAGEHVLVIEAAHACKPGTAAHCAASQVHRSWSFSSEARTPTGLDVRAFAESGGDERVHPALEMKLH